MQRTQGIARIDAPVRRPRGATLARTIADMEVSRTTVNRDRELIRDQMEAPIDWDTYERSDLDVIGYRTSRS